jgi:hypothetical protein
VSLCGRSWHIRTIGNYTGRGAEILTNHARFMTFYATQRVPDARPFLPHVAAIPCGR